MREKGKSEKGSVLFLIFSLYLSLRQGRFMLVSLVPKLQLGNVPVLEALASFSGSISFF